MSQASGTKPGSVLIYTRLPEPDRYSSHLAHSAHLAYSRDGSSYEALNRNYGILFATSTVSPRNTIREKGLKNPFLFRRAEGGFGIVAVRVQADGSEDEESKGRILLWVSDDLVHFREVGLVDLHSEAHVREAACAYDAEQGNYVVRWREDDGACYQTTLSDLLHPESTTAAEPAEAFAASASVQGLQGAVPGNALAVDPDFGEDLLLRWSPLCNTAISIPDVIPAASAEELASVRATAHYSDGSTAVKRVEWNVEAVDFSVPGRYEAAGTVTQEAYPFPLAAGYADPIILPWYGKYYFLATNDNTNDVGLFVREADTIAGLFAAGYRENEILPYNEEKGWIQTFWAPEFHVIGGELYLLFALGGKSWGPQSHMMKLKPGGRLIDPAGWEEPIRVVRQDGSPLTTDGITLDMTYFQAGAASYLVWSYRYGIMGPDDTGSMLYLATTDPQRPWQLTSEPVLLSRPLFGWENNEHTINNEGPYPLVTGDTVYLTYSGGSASGQTYAVGMLEARIGDDLLDPGHWRKASTPVLSTYSAPGEYGPGHNGFFTDRDGTVMITYHAETQATGGPRSTAMRRVHFNRRGEPVFDLTPDRDLNPELVRVRTTVLVPEKKEALE
ncbi:family 43 glycosylhydrolase [Gorillibacterium sp. sgz500922]|uniref:family 43 glycosylhydrolase n=1 Tax=Gorillibacterium sp. sgz500922 TaxID=3446694 RepID=UPI003F679051